MLKHPPPSDCCRLCVKKCNDDHHILYDETGQANANHDLVGKYFTNAMLNMQWEKRLQYICGKCWQHIWEFHQFEESIIEAQKGQHLHTEAAKEVKIKPELNLHINQQEVQLELSANTEESTKPPALTFDIKTEEPLDLNSVHEGISPQDEQDHLTNEEMLLTMPSRKDNSTLRNDDESNEDYSSNDDIPLTSLGHTNLFSLENKVSATNRLVEEFDELVALWRSSLECEICHQLVVSYSQLKEHFSKHHASEGCYLMCCKLRLETRYDIENHIRYHNAPQQLKCEACCKAFRLVAYLRKHNKIVHTDRGGDKNAKDNKKLKGKYCCCKCSKDFATEKQLNQHNLDVHKPKIYKCNVCEKTFMRPYALREHLAGHKGKQPHACSVCSKAFTWRSNFCQHMRKSHPQEWQKMQDEEAQREREKYRYRRETRGNGMVYVCIYCFKEYDSRFSMYYHAKRCQMYNTPKEPKKGFRLNTREEPAEQISMISEPTAPAEKVDIKPELNKNRQEIQQEVVLHNAIGLSASTEDSIKPSDLNFDIKSEEPLDLNSDHEEMSPQDMQDHLTDEEMSLMMSSRQENSSLQSDNKSIEDYYSNDDLPSSSLGQIKHCTSDNCTSATKKSAEEFDEVVALWRSPLECENCHQLVASYSQLKEHFSKYHASERCYLMCCQMRLETRYDIENHIGYHNAPQQLRCDTCCKVFRLVKYLRNHEKIVHTSKAVDEKAKDSEKLEGKYRCSKCSKDFATEQHLNNHSLNVHKPKNLECNFCGKSFTRSNVLRQHVASYHMGKSHPRGWKKMQNDATQNETKMEYRLETRGESTIHICIYCSKEYVKRVSMQNHIWRWHRDNRPIHHNKGYRREVRGESMVYVCSYCSQEYKKRCSIYHHIERCQGNDKPIEPKKGYRRETRGDNMVYVCIFCSREYPKLQSIHYHIYRTHRDEASLAKQEPTPSVQQQPIHSRRTQISQDSGSHSNEVANITPDGYNINELGKGEENSLMTPIVGKVLKDDENATNALGNKEMDEHKMPQEFEEATWESEESIKSEEEFIEL